jgi:hypothetical protein
MAKAAEPAVTAEEIVFELDRFERSDGQLNLVGRWFGVRGRRFVRPTLTLALDGERVRALADLDDKPWPAEDGEPWKASFPWGRTGRVGEPELSVAPDITIQLPVPNSRRARPQRLAAQPRREVMSASYGSFAAAAQEPGFDHELEPPGPEITPPEPPLPEPDPVALLAELDGLRVQLAEAERTAAASAAERESVDAEVAALRDALDEAREELNRRGGELEILHAELSATRAAREAALRSAAQAEAERDGALSRAAEAEAERDALATEKTELAAAVESSRSTVEQLTRQHDEAMTSRGAALVMRGATQALPAYEHHVGWLRRVLALLAMIGIVFAVLIVLGAL